MPGTSKRNKLLKFFRDKRTREALERREKKEVDKLQQDQVDLPIEPPEPPQTTQKPPRQRGVPGRQEPTRFLKVRRTAIRKAKSGRRKSRLSIEQNDQNLFSPGEFWKNFPNEVASQVTPAHMFVKKQKFGANEIIRKIFDMEDFECSCDHYIIGASGFLDMLRQKTNFDKQHKKFGNYGRTGETKSVEKSYANACCPILTMTRRSVRYPFLATTPDVIHKVGKTIYYDEIKSSSQENFSSFWNQRYLFQLLVASLTHKADHYRIIGIQRIPNPNPKEPDGMKIVVCITVSFNFDILGTDFIQTKMLHGYYEFLKHYFFCTGVVIEPNSFDVLKEKMLECSKKPLTATSIPSREMKPVCNIYLKAYDTAPKFEKLNFGATKSLGGSRKKYNELKAHIRFHKSLELSVCLEKNDKEAIKKHPYQRIDFVTDYSSVITEVKLLWSTCTMISVNIDKHNWRLFFDEFVSWGDLLGMFRHRFVELSDIKPLL